MPEQAQDTKTGAIEKTHDVIKKITTSKIGRRVVVPALGVGMMLGAAACEGKTTTTEPSLPSTTSTTQEVTTPPTEFVTTTTENTTETTEKALPDIWTSIKKETDAKIIDKLRENVYGDILSVDHIIAKDPKYPEEKRIGLYVITAKTSDGEEVSFIARDTDVIARPIILRPDSPFEEPYTTHVQVTGMVDYADRDPMLSFMLGGKFLLDGRVDASKQAYQDRTSPLLYGDGGIMSNGEIKLTPNLKGYFEGAPKLQILSWDTNGDEEVITYYSDRGQGEAIKHIAGALFANQQ
jgi:hypothetical protein